MATSGSKNSSSRRGFRHKFLEPLQRFRRSSSISPSRVNNQNQTIEGGSQLTASVPANECVTTTLSLHSIGQVQDAPQDATAIDDAAPSENGECGTAMSIHTRDSEETSIMNLSATLVDNNSSDLWSTAYREAVNSLGEDIDIAILKGKKVEQLFQELEEIDKEATGKSAFLRGLEHLKKVQVPLGRLKQVLDVATPLASAEPTAATVLGVVSGVTTIAISLASADIEFAKKIKEMLEQLSYIDECDTLGQKEDNKNIHKALVLVYQKILEFYKAAFEILTKKGAKLAVKILLANNNLAGIIQEFLGCASNLRNLILLATTKIMQDIKDMLYDQEIARWLGSDKLSGQSQYHASLQQHRADQACEFLLADGQFKNWYRATTYQQLVILGDMGSGKSVSMAFLVDELRRRNERQIPRPKVCYYYCRSDKTGTTIFILSTLILQLLEQFPGLKKSFFERYKDAQACGDFDPAKNIQTLEVFLADILDAVDRPLFFVIDGLDECERLNRNQLLRILTNLSQGNSNLKVILSSRPEEEILQRLTQTGKIDIGSNAERDAIIVRKRVESILDYLAEDVKALIIDTLSRLAHGSAIWTRMAIELIVESKIYGLKPMERFLARLSLPDNLSTLYNEILSRYTSRNAENKSLALTALKILTVSRRPLSILELAWSATLGSDPQEANSISDLAELVDHQRIMSIIRPFISHVDFSDTSKRQIRLVHQSAKDFIIKLSAPARFGKNGARTSEAALIESLEADLLNICTTYLLLDEIGRDDLFSGEQVAIEELPQDFDLFNNDVEAIDYDPYCTWEVWEETMIRYDPTERGFGEFFVYASCHWIEHFGAVSADLPTLASIENLCQVGSTRISNWIEQNRRPDCVIKPRFEFDSSLYDPLSITSLYGSETMLRNMLDNSDFTNGNFHLEPAIGAADQIFQWGELSRLKILFLEGKVRHQVQNLDFFCLALKRWSDSDKLRPSWNIVFDLIDNVLDAMVSEEWGNELLCIAAGKGCLPLIQRLMDNAARNAALRTELLHGSRQKRYRALFGKSVHQSIGEAVLGNHVHVVEYLLRQNGIEEHIQYQNSHGENVLHLASKACNPEIFRLLVPRFKEGVHQTDTQRNTPLSRVIFSSASSQNKAESAKILLLGEDGANKNRYPGDEENPLRMAVQLGDLKMCRLLITIGKLDPATALMHAEDGNVVLKDRSFGSEETVLGISKLLRGHATFVSLPPSDT